ncbi:MAG TPA: hypothetical protein VM841_12720 [Actinomycetota bacterium]|nr:hypothetical protein [Actinomycetota bacterium]
MGRPGRPKGSGPVRVGEVAPVYGGVGGALSRLEALIAMLGNNRVARLLDVSASQTSRWRSSKDRPSPDMILRIGDLDHVMFRLFGQMHATVALDWLDAHNEFIGTTPAEAIEAGEFGLVHSALALEAQGGFL